MDTLYLHHRLCCRRCKSACVIAILCPVSLLAPLQILQTIAGGSRGLSYIYAGRVIAGLGVGGISAVSPAYVSECAPKDVRGRITGLFQIMVAIGVMLSYFINCKPLIHIYSRLISMAEPYDNCQWESASISSRAPPCGVFRSGSSWFQLVSWQ